MTNSEKEKREKDFLKMQLELNARIYNERRKNFLETILIRAMSEFGNYEKGYRILSVNPSKEVYPLDDTLITSIANSLTEKYQCDLVSFSMSESTFSPQKYIFTFKK